MQRLKLFWAAIVAFFARFFGRTEPVLQTSKSFAALEPPTLEMVMQPPKGPRSVCFACSKRFAGNEWFLKVAVRSQRINTTKDFPFCSRECRDGWWDSGGTEDFHPCVPLDRTQDQDPGLFFEEDEGVVLFRQHPVASSSDARDFQDASGHAFARAAHINAWWRSAPAEDDFLENRPVACERTEDGLTFLEEAPEGWSTRE